MIGGMMIKLYVEIIYENMFLCNLINVFPMVPMFLWFKPLILTRLKKNGFAQS